MNISDLDDRPLLVLFDGVNRDHIPVIIVGHFVACLSSVKFSDDFEFAAPSERAQGLTSVADAPLFVSLVFMAVHIATAKVFKLALRDPKTIIDDIESYRSLLDQSDLDLLRMHFNSIFNKLTDPNPQLIIKAWRELDIRVEKLSIVSDDTLIIVAATSIPLPGVPWFKCDPRRPAIPSSALPVALELLIFVLCLGAI